MAITYPVDILADFPGWSTDFQLLWRQEQSRQANGRTIVKDMGSPLWTATYQSRPLRPNELDEWRARLDALENGLQTFRGYATSRCYPIAYPNGSWPTGGSFDGVSATIYAIGSGNKSLQVDLLPVGFELRPGDMIQVDRDPGYDVYRVVEAATADGDGITTEFEVRPHLWPGTAINDVVSVKRPWCPMAIVPGSISTGSDSTTGRGAVGFQAIEVR